MSSREEIETSCKCHRDKATRERICLWYGDMDDRGSAMISPSQVADWNCNNFANINTTALDEAAKNRKLT